MALVTFFIHENFNIRFVLADFLVYHYHYHSFIDNNLNVYTALLLLLSFPITLHSPFIVLPLLFVFALLFHFYSDERLVLR